MRSSRSPFVAAATLGVLSAIGFVSIGSSGCSSNDPRPNPAGESSNRDDGSVNLPKDGSAAGADAQIADSGSDVDATLPPSPCQNTIRDGNETDIDCGGNVCAKCIDGKACIASTDCAGGSCVDRVCKKAECSNRARDGEETDIDCGGTICAKCTIGKRCKAASDCVGGSCVGDACACPTGMVTVPKADGGAYCIDEVEVTKGLYNKFFSSGFSPDDQIAVCKAPVNPDFGPREAWPPQSNPPGGPTGSAFNLGLPVHYVNWCQAHTYCRWVGKQLCGKIDGGPNSPQDANVRASDAWYNACSSLSNNAYPYGNGFLASKCNGHGSGVPGPVPGQLFGYSDNKDDGVYQVVNSDSSGTYTPAGIQNTGCLGGVAGLYQMSGNVAEWEDACDGNDATSSCLVRGGSYRANNNPEQLKCTALRSVRRVPPKPTDDEADAGVIDPLKDIGFRCCLY